VWRDLLHYYPSTITIGGITSLDDLYDEVHIIAYYYKWGEKEILSLPSFKRRMYLERIDKQIKAENQTEEEREMEV
jgi:hypothetical protein